MESRLSYWRKYLPTAKQVLAAVVASQLLVAVPVRANDGNSNDGKTTSPIKHVIIIIGENRSFDHVYATYVPKKGQTVDNLLSKGIVNADGTPGPNYALSAQYSAVNSGEPFSIAPGGKAAYASVPAPLTGGPEFASADAPPFLSLKVATTAETGLFPTYDFDLLTGATGLPGKTPDNRINDISTLGGGVFQLTPGVRYDDYAASPVHRFYQMWQQLDCDATKASKTNPQRLPSGLVSLGRDVDRRRQTTGTRSLQASTTRPPAKARRRWRSTTCRTAMLLTSSTLQTPTRSATTFTSR